MRLRRLLPIGLIAGGIAAGPGLVGAQSYPHSFPREGVVKLHDHERFTVWEVNWKHGVEHPIHQHRYDMASVFLRYGAIKMTQPNGTVNTGGQPFVPPQPYFQRKGVTHKEEGTGGPNDPERLAVTVDLKDGVTVAPLVVKPGTITAFPRVGATDVLDNERVRMWDYTWQVKRPVPMHLHDTDTVEIFVDGGTLMSTTPDGKQETYTVAFKQARVVPRGLIHAVEAKSGAPRAFIVELK